jgi:hypothetical protein
MVKMNIKKNYIQTKPIKIPTNGEGEGEEEEEERRRE